MSKTALFTAQCSPPPVLPGSQRRPTRPPPPLTQPAHPRCGLLDFEALSVVGQYRAKLCGGKRKNTGKLTTARVTKAPDYTWRERCKGTVGCQDEMGVPKGSQNRTRAQPIQNLLSWNFKHLIFLFGMGNELVLPLITIIETVL